ncbi:MAG: ERAP1-like C-terminal domain-containing protein, partial [Chloroflexota bacterium]
LPGARWYFPNGGAAGFYRCALDDRSVTLLAGELQRLRPEERLVLLDDQWALARARRAPLARFVELVAGLRGERDRAVLQLLSGLLGWLSEHVVTDEGRTAFDRFVDRIYRPELEALGWDPRPDDSSDEREKRAICISALGTKARAEDVRREARRRIEAHLASGPRIAPDLAGVLAAVGAIDGDSALYERYVARMQESAKADAQEESRFRSGLIDFADDVLVRRTAEGIFTDLIREQDRPLMLIRMLGLRRAREQAWRVVREKWDERVATMDPGGKQRVVTGIGQLTPRKLAPDAIAFLRDRLTPDIKETATQAIERLRLDSATAERMAAELPEALEQVAERV